MHNQHKLLALRAPRSMPTRPAATADRTRVYCLAGKRSGDACCAADCGECSSEPGCEANAVANATACCARTIRRASAPCTSALDTACLIPGAADAAVRLCFSQMYMSPNECAHEPWLACAAGACDESIALGTRRRHGASCQERAMVRFAKERGMAPWALRQEVLSRCLAPGPRVTTTASWSAASAAIPFLRASQRPSSNSSPTTAAAPAAAAAAAPSVACPVPRDPEGRVVVAVVVRDQVRPLPSLAFSWPSPGLLPTFSRPSHHLI